MDRQHNAGRSAFGQIDGDEANGWTVTFDARPLIDSRGAIVRFPTKRAAKRYLNEVAELRAGLFRQG